jgi:hypothetical protein
MQRAQALADQHPFAAEILGFYVHVARFQDELHQRLNVLLQSPAASADRELTASELAELGSRFESFLAMAEAHGPKPLAGLSRELRIQSRDAWSDLLQAGWTALSPSDARVFSPRRPFSPMLSCFACVASFVPLQQPTLCVRFVIASPLSASCARWEMAVRAP